MMATNTFDPLRFKKAGSPVVGVDSTDGNWTLGKAGKQVDCIEQQSKGLSQPRCDSRGFFVIYGETTEWQDGGDR